MRRTITLFFAAVVAMAILVPAAAQASTASQRAAKADRNHDQIPDRWERKHGLSLRVKQTRLDQDRDGLNNLGEFKAGTDPRDADTDNDGLRDGAEMRVGDNPRERDSDHDGVGDAHENAGTVDSFTGGVLTIRLASGGTVSGRVVDGTTQVECKRAATAPTATASRETESGDDSGGDNSGPGTANSAADDNSGPGGDDDPGDDDHGARGDNGDEVACSSADLTQGTVVHEASLQVTDAGAVFREVELVK